MRRGWSTFVVFLMLAAAAACVGDDPAVGGSGNDAGSDGGGSDTGVSPDGESVSDASTVDDSPANDSSILDSSTADADSDADADVDARPPPATPDQLFDSRLVLWLDANAAGTVALDINNNLSVWHDRTNNSNNASVVMSGTGHLTVAKGGTGSKNLDAINFPGDDENTGALVITDNATLRFAGGDYLLAFLVAYTNRIGTDGFGAYGTLWSKSDDSEGFPYWGVNVIANMSASFLPDGGAGGYGSWIFAGEKSFADEANGNSGVHTAAQGYNNGLYHLVIARRSNGGTTMGLWVDGTPASATIPPYNLDNVGDDVKIGGKYYSATEVEQQLQGQIAEIIAVKGSVTDSEVATFTSYIDDKYGFSF